MATAKNEDADDAAATSAMFVFTADKAGMKGVDKQHVQEVVHKMSKDSSFYQKSLRDNEKVEQRVLAMREKLAGLTGGQQLRLQQEADARVAQMEATRDLSRTIVVVDMDMFYAAVEMRDNPKLRDVPLAVGGLNMISTTNYAARQFGVRAAMPGFIGKELCPQLHFVPVNMKKYAGVAAQIRAVFAEYDPDFEAFSLDEACLDLTDYMAKNWQQYVVESDGKQQGRAAIAEAIVHELRKKIFETTQLTASAGIAVNTMLAKICSDMNKPNGQYVLPFTRECVMTFIRDLPVRKIGGIGKVTEKILNEALNVHNGGELFAQRGRILHLFSEKTADWLLQTSLGVRERREKQERKSFSRERTFGRLSDPQQLEAKCLEICKLLAKDLAKANKAAKNVTFVYKDTDFARCSRSMTLASAIFTAEDLYANAVELLRRELPLTLRLMGVRASTLVSRSENSNCSANPSDEDVTVSKKRQIAINTFAERITGPVEVQYSEASRRTVQSFDERTQIRHRGAMATYLSALKYSTSFKKESFACPECRETLPVDVKNHFDPDAHKVGCVLVEAASSSSFQHSTRKKHKKNDIQSAFIPNISALEVDNKPCPICGKMLNARNNMEVNAHMDACVGTKQVSSTSSPLRRTLHKTQKKNIMFTSVQKSTQKSEEDVKPCPICGKRLNTRSNMEVNAHMDACVTRDRSMASQKRGAQEIFKKKSENSIDVFFCKSYKK